jgi:dTDP-4-amino-4,6-dideoxygalactose transaminase
VPSFTFSSTANAILLGNNLKPVFADVDPKTLNIDPDDIKRKITPKTRAIIVVHYAGVSCDMHEIMDIARKHKLQVIEDAAQAIESSYKGKYLGTIGDFGCMSFHDTKNITCGEGGALFINSIDKAVHEKAEIMREKGTNRSKFFRGLIDKYTWVDVGSSYLPSDLLAAFLYAQLENIDHILTLRKERYEYYRSNLASWCASQSIQLPTIPDHTTHNAHIFYMLLPTNTVRNHMLDYLRAHGVGATFHYIPLHSAPAGIISGAKASDCPVTTDISGRLLRLPLFSAITKEEQDFVIQTLKDAFSLHT